MLSFKFKKQTSKNVADTTFKKHNPKKKERKIMIEFDYMNADSLSNNRTLMDSNISIILISCVLVFFQK